MTHTIEFFIYPDTTGLDLTGPLEVFNTASELLIRDGKPEKAYHPVFSGPAADPVRLSSGLTVIADCPVGEGPSPDTLLIPGGTGAYGVAGDEELLSRILRAAKRAGRVVSVCNGAVILAACGLLEGRRATTHWMTAESLAKNYPGVTVLPDAIFVRDGNIATSAGVTAGIDLALALVEEAHGAGMALEIARILVLYLRRSGGQSQFSAPLESRRRAGTRFGDLHDWLVEHLVLPLSVEDMAERAGMSLRNFFRVFTQETGMTPGRYLETLRLDRARELLESGDDALSSVAESSGFGREERLRRAFVNRFNVTPAQYRIHFGSRQMT